MSAHNTDNASSHQGYFTPKEVQEIQNDPDNVMPIIELPESLKPVTAIPKSIEQQIEALTQELRPYSIFEIYKEIGIYYFDGKEVDGGYRWSNPSYLPQVYEIALFISPNKAEVEEYADCYRRLKLYQLLGKKAEKEHPLKFDRRFSMVANYEDYKGTDFFCGDATTGLVVTINNPRCVLGGVWFAREEDRLEALELAGIDKVFQERCAKHGLGGA